MTGAVLETRGLEKRFVTHRPLFGTPTEVHAVNGVDLAIHEGETFAIVGESGCGKSTLARMLIGLIRPSAGQVLYQGREMSGLPQKQMRALRRDLQFIFQDPFSSLNPRMTIGRLVEEPMRAHGIGTPGERRERVGRLLARVGLRPEHADRYPHEFSGGQRQRIGIARALASGPKVLIGDEPVSALDVSIQAQVVNMLEDLKEEFGLTLVVIAHDLAVIRHMSDRVAVMYLGEVVETGPVDAVFDAPAHPYTRALMGAIPVPAPGARDSVAAILEGDVPNPTAPPPGCRFHTRCPFAVARCTRERPALADMGGGRRAACHLRDELPAFDTRAPEPGRTPGAARRFELWRTARSAGQDDRHRKTTQAEETQP
ncbi:ATP-binding cassette domain-containing protein [Limibaculum sp. M0105]|uniref:ATP-binding cassette domain-containing protein n=1 Tax=Thermohalobaculum xanthum TaxID=2753746 RepID=A0A8J7M7R3_9RHOB|nr:oligopeptide/dipeptide ABC transporter ATP-binding protein [Thermohalobaculum xanthum]MBK0399442.1 ATP-binding cassette domain-containing protein [Thermohalobaculum xanthum]